MAFSFRKSKFRGWQVGRSDKVWDFGQGVSMFWFGAWCFNKGTCPMIAGLSSSQSSEGIFERFTKQCSFKIKSIWKPLNSAASMLNSLYRSFIGVEPSAQWCCISRLRGCVCAKCCSCSRSPNAEIDLLQESSSNMGFLETILPYFWPMMVIN
jgi:hypothetical protein